jgi:ribosome-binding factor A
MKAHRMARVTEAVREVASSTILFELKDPRVRNVTVTRAEVSGDLQHAKVYVSIMGSEQEQKLCLHGLQHAAGFIQSKLADRMKTRYTPVVTFVLDKGVKNSIEVTRLIHEALAQHPKSAADAEGADGDAAATTQADAADGPAAPESA